MSSRPLKAAIAVAVAGAFSLTASPAHAAPDPATDVQGDLTTAYADTAVYAYEPWASSEGGYVPTDVCVPETGYRYVNEKYVGSLDPGTPAALLYEGGADRSARQLVGVEWVVPDTGQSKAPELFDTPFEKNGALKAWTLHAWLHKANPKGTFTTLNSDVKCSTTPAAPAATTVPDWVTDLENLDWTTG
ncbi:MULTISPECIES: hypothetical protein [unclassified Streptomyces]|uniref:hypothetical protein n=1 Tax=unclassified Streptomyces TaxID=2593676 RepID=UPI0036E05466